MTRELCSVKCRVYQALRRVQCAVCKTSQRKRVPTYYVRKRVPTYHVRKRVPTYHVRKRVPTYYVRMRVPTYHVRCHTRASCLQLGWIHRLLHRLHTCLLANVTSLTSLEYIHDKKQFFSSFPALIIELCLPQVLIILFVSIL